MSGKLETIKAEAIALYHPQICEVNEELDSSKEACFDIQRTVDQHILSEYIGEAIALLDEIDRKIIMSKYILELPIDVTTVKLGISKSVYHHRCAKALYKLGVILEQKEIDLDW